MLLCAAFLLAAVAAATAWGRRPFSPPPPPDELTPVEVVRRFVWYASLLIVGGVTAGIPVIGGGGRLAMRLLAFTAGTDAQGRVTEADEVVGTITLGGTLSFAVFNGIFGGLAAAALYLLARRFLPAGRLGGAAFGLALLVVLGTVVDPLRRDNPDFDIVGPGWLAVLVFVALALVFGVVLAAFMARLSEWLPLPSTDRRVLVRYALPAVIAAVAFSASIMLAVLCLAVVAVTRWNAVPDAVRSHRWVLAGRVVLSVLVALALPGAVGSMVDIAGR